MDNGSLCDNRDPANNVRDVRDGVMLAEPPLLGDPEYEGPPRVAFIDYYDYRCGHSKSHWPSRR